MPGDASPIYLSAGDAASVVLLLHGFTGTPFEVHLLAADLHRRGYTCHAPLLAGHGGSVAALGATTWQDWLDSAERALLDLSHGGGQPGAAAGAPRPPLAVIGLSMGGLLTLMLCRRHPALIDAICLLATPLWLRPYQLRAIAALARSPLAGLSLPKLFGPDVRDPEMRQKNPATRGMPLRALDSLCQLMAEVRQHLPEIRHPAFCAHGVRDHTVPCECLGELGLRLGTPRDDLRCLMLPQSYHLIPIDVEREVLFAAIAAHLDRHLVAVPAGHHAGPAPTPA